ncbi:hypothetical protein Q4485_04050 [Granulosicoccaceae sp. 1_MG-2023]|nr:hypothetical protein [Granulosicoccaceae sp. 1_MG-2023]
MAIKTPGEVLLTISIDTECDHDPNWARSKPLRFDSINIGMPERLQPLFNEVGAIPTYLLTVEVLEDDESVESLKKLQGQYEYGTHLHAAFVEPQKKFYDYAGIDSPDFQNSYAPEIELAKLRNLTALFQERLGYAPTSFRAGRYGAGNHTLPALRELGYKVDTSVTPHIRWFEPNGCADFRRAPEQPYFPAPGVLNRAGKHQPEADEVLEVPVTVRNRLFRRYPRWFRPWYSSVDEMKDIFHYHLRRYGHQETLVINMMFHSMEVIEAASPYPQTSDDVRMYLDDTYEILDWARAEGVKFKALSDVRDYFGKQG